MQWSLHIPAGVYSYEVTAEHAANNALDVECSYYDYMVALPKEVRRYAKTMYNGLGDPIPRVYIFGLAPKGTRVSVVHFADKALKCGGRFPDRFGTSMATERTEQGYYASDSLLSAEHETAAVFGVQVNVPGAAEPRTFRVIADYPDSIVALLPTYARFDITLQMLKEAQGVPANVLICEVARTTNQTKGLDGDEIAWNE